MEKKKYQQQQKKNLLNVSGRKDECERERKIEEQTEVQACERENEKEGSVNVRTREGD